MADHRVGARSALYLYGVSRSSKNKPPKVNSPSVDGLHQVEALPCDEFICWVSPVDHVAFSREMESNMENLEWLALHGVRHQQVVAEIADCETVVPARFATLFSSEAALRKDLQGRASALAKVFARIADSDEWGVKVLAEEQPPVVASKTSAASGRDYLQQKAARMTKKPERNDAELQQFAAALEKAATDSAPAGKVSGSQPGLLWQATFLVARSRRKQWEAVLQQFVKQWQGKRRIEVTGPWPPYSFVSDAK
jgi:Gas vesicle synthesis protein GvpL/GvpF